jgi:type VII secretion protein EccE
MVTTQAPGGGRVRASAQLGAAAPAGPLRLTAPRGRGRLLGLRTGQLVALEIAALAVLATLRGPLPLTAATGAAALIIALSTLGRSHGRWWYEAYLAGRRLRRRRAARRADRHPDPRMAALRELAPALRIAETDERGTSLGIAQDAAGWFAALEVAPGGGVLMRARPAVPLGQLAALLDEHAAPLSALQVVVHTVPAPVASLAADAPAVVSYRQLTGATEDGLLPADEITWIAVRLEAPDAAEAAPSRGGGVAGVHRALAAALGRVGQILTSAGIPYRPLDAEGLVAALARSCAIGERGLTVASGEPRTEEVRHSWRADGTAHVSFWVESWPTMTAANPVLGRLARVSADTVTLSTVLTAAPSGVRVQGLVRVSGDPSAVEHAADAVTRLAHDLKFALRRQNGQQAPAAYASAPTGGGPG